MAAGPDASFPKAVTARGATKEYKWSTNLFIIRLDVIGIVGSLTLVVCATEHVGAHVASGFFPHVIFIVALFDEPPGDILVRSSAQWHIVVVVPGKRVCAMHKKPLCHVKTVQLD